MTTKNISNQVHRPTPKLRKFVRSAAKRRMPHTEMAPLMGITPKTLRKYYRKELDEGRQIMPRLCADKFEQYMKRDMKSEEGQKYQALLAFRYMQTEGWNDTLNIDVQIGLQPVITRALPPRDGLAIENAVEAEFERLNEDEEE